MGYSITKRILPRMRAMREVVSDFQDMPGPKRIARKKPNEDQHLDQNMSEDEELRSDVAQKGKKVYQRMRRRRPMTRRNRNQLAFNINALYLSDASFEAYLENTAKKLNKPVVSR